MLAKVDNQNLNVYLEVGYSIGRKKEIVLICAKEAIDNLPANLRGLDLLEYNLGNYNQLKLSIIEHFNKKYGYNQKTSL